MTLPSVDLSQLDGQLGILPPSAGRLAAYVGPCSAGTAAVPTAFGTVKALKDAFGVGPAIEAAAHFIERYGKPVLFVKTAASVAGAAGTVTQTGTGATVATVHTGAAPNDDYEVLVKCVAGGTVGVAGITYQVSLDGGRNYGAVTALGTAALIAIAEAGTLQIDLTTATWVAGDTIAFRTTAATWNATDLGAALTALGNAAQVWRNAAIIGPFDGTAFDTVDAAFASLAAAGKYHGWIGSFRIPTAGESEGTYATAFGTAFNAKAGIYGGVCAGACKMISSVVSGRKYRRPIVHAVAARQASVSEEINIAAIRAGGGSLPGVSIRDDNGNVDEHDESVSPGLDDLRAITLRTWDSIQGVYITQPNLLSASGSDFDAFPKREVMNLALIAVRASLLNRLEVPVRVDTQTGFIFEPDARDIESGVVASMTAEVMDVPKASGVAFVLSRTDNILSTKRLRGQARVTPLGYPKTISVDVGFTNPALQVTTV